MPVGQYGRAGRRDASGEEGLRAYRAARRTCHSELAPNEQNVAKSSVTSNAVGAPAVDRHAPGWCMNDGTIDLTPPISAGSIASRPDEPRGLDTGASSNLADLNAAFERPQQDIR